MPTEPLRVIDGERESSRLRFNRAEFGRALEALEMVDGADYDLAMRVISLEDQRAQALELATKWRKSYEVMKEIAAASAEHQVWVLDRAMREWVGGGWADG